MLDFEIYRCFSLFSVCMLVDIFLNNCITKKFGDICDYDLDLWPLNICFSMLHSACVWSMKSLGWIFLVITYQKKSCQMTTKLAQRQQKINSNHQWGRLKFLKCRLNVKVPRSKMFVRTERSCHEEYIYICPMWNMKAPSPTVE